jgi:methyl-accepting chemotaxis protein
MKLTMSNRAVNKLSLRVKLMLEILPIFLGIVVTSTIVVVIATTLGGEDLSAQQMTNLSSSYANQIDADVKSYQTTGHLLANFLASSTSLTTRSAVIDMLKNTLNDNQSLNSAYVVFEPNAFDKMDADFSNKDVYDATGRFAIILTRQTGSKSYTHGVPADYTLADYYLIPKSSHEDMVMEPALTDGKLTIRYVSPIMRGGKFIGVAGVDTLTSALDQTVKNIKVLDHGYAFLVSKNGTFISYKDTGLVGTETLVHYAAGLKNNDIGKLASSILTGKENNIKTKDVFTGKAVSMYSAPVKTGGWGLVVVAFNEDVLYQINLLRDALIGLCVVACIFLVWYILFIAGLITRPIAQLNQAANQIASGDLNVSLSIRSQDELGQTASAFQRMVTYLHTIANAAQRIAKQDLAVEVEPISSRDVLGNAFVEMVDGLRLTISDLNDNISKLKTASAQLAEAAAQSGQATNQIATTIQEVATGTAEQTQSVNQTISAVEQMVGAITDVARGAQAQSESIQEATQLTGEISSSIQKVAKSAESVSARSDQAANTAEDASRTVNQTIQGMRSIREKVTASSDKVAEMGKRSEQIGVIVNTINDIASQTNLLAINAAIETAHAETQATQLTDNILNRQMITQANLINQILVEKRSDRTQTFWTDLCHRAQVDTICITDKTGVVVYSEDPSLIGWKFPEDPKAQAFVFRKLIGQKDGAVCQKAALRSWDQRLFKYVGVPRMDEPGIVQIGFEASTLTEFQMRLGGFAVVADEVRKLAEKSGSATREITVLVKDIRHAVTEAVKAMTESAEQVEDGVQKAGDSGQALKGIIQAVEEVLNEARQSTDAANQMAMAANQLVSAMDSVSTVVSANTKATQNMENSAHLVRSSIESIASVSEETSAAAEEVSASTEEVSASVESVTASANNLAEMANELQTVVAKFHVEVTEKIKQPGMHIITTSEFASMPS